MNGHREIYKTYKRNNNNMIVKTRADHFCYECKTTIKAGSTCLAVNSVRTGRRWVCKNCLYRKINQTQFSCPVYDSFNYTLQQQKALPFDDEGAYLACDAYLVELSKECDKCYNTSCPLYS